MPNWCSDFLTIEGPGAEQFIKDSSIDDKFCFRALVPHPTDVKESIMSYSDLWGTKWDVDGDAYVDTSDPEHATVSMSTAWSPPIEWMKAVAKMYPNLKFTLEYEEGGMCFAGRMIVQGEEVIEDKYVETYEEYKKFCIDELGHDAEVFEDEEELEEIV